MRRVLLIVIILFLPSVASAQFTIEEHWHLKMQIGGWFGPVTPFPSTRLSDELNTNLGGGGFFRFNIPTEELRLELGLAYTYYDSLGPQGLHASPYYGSLDYMLPLELPLTFQVKLGGGGIFLKNLPEEKEGHLPIVMAGLEASFPAGKYINIGVIIHYNMVIEQHLNVPEGSVNYQLTNGHLLNFGLMVNGNIF